MEIYLADENAVIDISTQFPSEFDPSKATWPPEVTYDPLSNTLTRADVIVTSFEYVYDCGNGFSMYVLVECKF